MFSSSYKIEAGIYAWDVYERKWYSPFFRMFPVISFTNKEHAKQWIKERAKRVGK